MEVNGAKLKLLGVFGAFLLIVNISAQPMNKGVADSIVSAITLFVDSTPEYKYEAFLMRVYLDNALDSNTCLSLTYIRNSNESDFISPGYYLEIGDHFVQISLEVPESKKKILVEDLKLEKLSLFKRVPLVQKLYPSILGVISYHNPATLVLCWNKEVTFKKRYTNGFEIPAQHRIRPSLDKDRIEFKKLEPDEMQRRMKKGE